MARICCSRGVPEDVVEEIGLSVVALAEIGEVYGGGRGKIFTKYAKKTNSLDTCFATSPHQERKMIRRTFLMTFHGVDVNSRLENTEIAT